MAWNVSISWKSTSKNAGSLSHSFLFLSKCLKSMAWTIHTKVAWVVMDFYSWSLLSSSLGTSIRFKSSRKKSILDTYYLTSCIIMEKCWRYTSSASCATSLTAILNMTRIIWTSTISILEAFLNSSMASTTPSHHTLMILLIHRTTLARAHIYSRTSKRFSKSVTNQPF